MSARRLVLGCAALVLASGAVLVAGAYLIADRASARYERAVAALVDRQLAERRARTLPVALGEVSVPDDDRARRRATVAARRRALPAHRRELALMFLGLLGTVTVGSLAAARLLAGRQVARMRAELRERVEAAAEAQRAFAGHASHELRTPLSVIRAEVDACLDGEAISPDQWRRSAEAVRRNAVRSERVVQQLLLLARAGARPAVTHPVDLAEVAQSLLEELAGERRVDCRLADARTEGDPALLEAAIANLIENAVRYNVAAGVIELTSWTEDGRACLTVGNDGPPVDADDLERLFEPFVRGRADGDRRGTGLGLAIVEAIVRAHDGTVDAAARPNGGLDFTIRLPAAR